MRIHHHIMIGLVLICGCGPNVDYEEVRYREIAEYLAKNPDAVSRVVETCFVLFVKEDPEIGWEIARSEEKFTKARPSDFGLTDLKDEELEKGVAELIVQMKSAKIIRTEEEWNVVKNELKTIFKEMIKENITYENKRRLFRSFIVMLLCTSEQKEYLQDEVRKNFYSRVVMTGMNKNDVIVIKGQPDSSYESTDSTFINYSSWEYNSYRGSETIRFRDGVVIDISTYRH